MTGEAREAQMLVGVLGASNFTFAEATWTQSLSDWTGSHVRSPNVGVVVRFSHAPMALTCF